MYELGYGCVGRWYPDMLPLAHYALIGLCFFLVVFVLVEVSAICI